jgi:hypothetical protein
MKKYTNKILVIGVIVGIVYLGTMGVLTVQELKSQQEYLIYRKFCRFVCWATESGTVEVGAASAPLTEKMTADTEGNVKINGISGKVVVEGSGDVVKISTPQGSWKVTFVNFDNTNTVYDMKIILNEVN